MTLEEFNKKWGNIDRYSLDEDKHIEFVNDCFDMYEEDGFLDTFDSPYEELGKNGMKFKVLNRVPYLEGKVDLECLPLWEVEFENGEMATCYPEEICKIEHKN